MHTIVVFMATQQSGLESMYSEYMRVSVTAWLTALCSMVTSHLKCCVPDYRWQSWEMQQHQYEILNHVLSVSKNWFTVEYMCWNKLTTACLPSSIWNPSHLSVRHMPGILIPHHQVHFVAQQHLACKIYANLYNSHFCDMRWCNQDRSQRAAYQSWNCWSIHTSSFYTSPIALMPYVE